MKALTALGIFIAFGVVLLVGLSFFTPKAYAEPCNCFDSTDCAVGETCDTDNTMCTVTGGNVGVCVAGGGTPTPTPTPTGTDTGTAVGVGDMATCSGTTGCTGATCRWGKCATTADPKKIEFTFTIPNTCIGYSRWSGGRYVPANPCATNAVSFPDSVKTAYASGCLHSILLTQVQSDDYGKVCAGAGCSASSTQAAGTATGPPGGSGGGAGDGGDGAGAGGRAPVASVVAKPTFSVTGFATGGGGVIYTAASNGVWSPNIDATNAFDSTNPQVSLYVSDTVAAANGAASRAIGATFKVIILNPSPTEKCIMDSATGKPKIRSLCDNTTTSCTQTPTENASLTAPRCIDLTSMNGWQATGPAVSKCVNNNQYKAMVTPQTYRTATCTKSVTDPTFVKYGNYMTNATAPATPPGGGGSTRDNWTTRTSCGTLGCNPATGQCRTGGGGGCPAGQTLCSDGVCRTNCGESCIRPPSITSITAAPRRVAPTGNVTMTSVGSSPETITTGGSTRQMKVRLECGTSEGNIQNGGGGGGGGGGSVPNILSTVQSVRANYGAQPSPSELGQMLNEMAWIERAGGWGLSTKTGGERCPSPQGVDVACDVLYHRPTNIIVDVLIGAGEQADPAWQVLGQNTDSSRPWLAPIQPSGSPTGAATTRPTFSVTGFATGLPCAGGGSGYRDKMQQGVLPGRLARLDSDPSVVYSPGFDALSHMQCINPSGSGAIQTLLNLLNADIANGVITKPGCETGLSLDSNGNIKLCSDESDSYIGIKGGNWVWEYYTTTGASSTGAGSSCQSGSFTANLCTGDFANNNPTCNFTIPMEWRTGGQKNIYCRLKDETGLYSNASRTSIIVDNTPPTSRITEPAANSVQIANFRIKVTDTDDSGLDKCYYTTSNGTPIVLPPDPILLPGTSRPPVGTCEWAYERGVNANDPTAIYGECRGVLWGGIRNINTALGCSQSFTYHGVPASEWAAWRSYAQAVIDVCNTFPEDYVISSSQLATLQNALGPLRSTCPAGSKGITCVCNPDPADPTCGQFVPLIGNITASTNPNPSGVPVGAKLRTCNGMTTITVGPGGDCANQGVCLVSVFARDTNGNVGTPDSRSFNINLIFTNITTPLDGSNQTGNFSVEVDDRDFTSTTQGTLTCTYDVYSIGSSSIKTVNNAARRCNNNFTVTVGPDGNCTSMGQGTCRVVAKVNKTINNTRVEDSSQRFYNIDWVTPFSEILSAPNNWITSDFTISVSDNAQGVASRISKCQYKVVSNITQTVPWTDRTCGIGAPVDIPITVGTGKNCRHEGGDACTIFVRPIDRAGNPGIEDNVSVPIIFDVTDINGFSNMLTVQTERGLNFSGTTRQALRLYTFYVCNKNSNVNSCIAAYDSNNKGPSMPNFCGSLLGKCEMRCSDRTVSYYFAAKGTPAGQTTTATVVSPIMTASCPTFNIDRIDEWYQIFTRLDAQIGTEIGIVDSCMIQNGESEICNPETLAILQEALLITKDHLRNMTLEMQDLTVTRAAQLIARSLEKRDDISALLGKIRPPTQVVMTVDMPEVVRFNRSMDLTATVNKNGPGTAYGTFYCNIRKPGALAPQSSRSSCLSLGSVGQYTTTYTVPFMPDRLGTWTYSCILGRSIRSDCSFEVNQTPVGGTFAVLPAASTFISSLSAPSSVVRGSIATINAVVTNPDSSDRFVNVTCSFKYFANGQLITRRNSSVCINSDANADTTAAINMYGGTLGEWNATGCSVYSSSLSSCASSTLDNVSLDTARYMVILPDTVFIESVGLPQAPVVNNSQVSIPAVLNNPTRDAAYVTLTCGITKPLGTFIVTDRKGIDFGRTSTFTLDFTTDKVGTWTMNTCNVSSSVNPDFSDSSVVYTINNVGSFNVIRSTNLSFVSFSLPPDTLVNNNVQMQTIVRNPFDIARYARVFCSFRTPQNQIVSNSSSCLQVAGTSTMTLSVNMFANTAGTWNVDTCTLRGSLDSSCTDFQDSRSGIGTFNITTVTPPPSVALSQLFVSNISANTAALNNSRISVLVYGRNENPANSSYALVGCEFVNPFGGVSRQSSSCMQATANSTTIFSVSQLMDMAGTWTVRNCFINASGTNNCAPSLLHNVSTESRVISVSLPNNLYITGVTAPSSGVVNNTNVDIDIFVSNPLNDDRYGFVSCIIENPNGANQTKTAACSSVPRQTSNKQYRVSVFANAVGTWNVRNCSVSSSTSASCSGSSPTGELINGDTFNVIRGYNLTISSMSVPASVYVNQPLNVAYTLRNPSTSERFARVTCTMTKSGQSATNTSSCMTIGPESFIDSRAAFVPSSTGTWTVTCAAERSYDATCSSIEVHDRNSKEFNATNPPDLFIQSVDIPSLAPKDFEVFATLRIRNTGLTSLYGFAQCTFKNRLNETTYNASECTNMTADTTIVSLGVTPALRGNWSVYNCYVNATPLTNCSSSRVHNISTTEKSFNVYAPVLSFVGDIYLTSTNLVVGDVADIAVNVKNTGERPYLTFVNCTIINPVGVSYMLTTTPQTLQIDETRDFHPQRQVDVSGTWRVGSCSIYSISSPPKLEASKTVNQIFDVLYAASTDECSNSVPCQSGFTCENGKCVAIPQPQCTVSNCPGTSQGCYCSNDRCVSCGQGYTCSQAKCVPETPIINTCRSTSDCTTGNVCVNGVCQQRPPECYGNNDCRTGYECSSGSCVASAQRPMVDQRIIYFLIILLAVIMVPIILFIYIKRAI